MAANLHLTTFKGRQLIKATPHLDPAGLADLLAKRGLSLNTRCCNRGLCKGCMVRLESGSLRASGTGKTLRAPAEVLACHAEWLPDTEIALTIPSRSLLAHKPSVSDDFGIRVPVGNDPLFDEEFGLAVDIGTTTVVVLLAELSTGRILARASDFNQQIRMGDDVLARIELCQSQPDAVTIWAWRGRWAVAFRN